MNKDYDLKWRDVHDEYHPETITKRKRIQDDLRRQLQEMQGKNDDFLIVSFLSYVFMILLFVALIYIVRKALQREGFCNPTTTQVRVPIAVRRRRRDRMRDALRSGPDLARTTLPTDLLEIPVSDYTTISDYTVVPIPSTCPDDPPPSYDEALPPSYDECMRNSSITK